MSNKETIGVAEEKIGVEETIGVAEETIGGAVVFRSVTPIIEYFVYVTGIFISSYV